VGRVQMTPSRQQHRSRQHRSRAAIPCTAATQMIPVITLEGWRHAAPLEAKHMGRIPNDRRAPSAPPAARSPSPTQRTAAARTQRE